MSDWGFKSSRGDDVFTADDKDLAVTTKYSSALMQEDHVAVYDYTFPDDPAGDRTLVTVAHGYSYTPLALVYVYDVTENQYAMLRYNIAALGNPYQRLVYYTDGTNFKLQYIRSSDPTSVDMEDRQYIFKYFIWVQRGM